LQRAACKQQATAAAAYDDFETASELHNVDRRKRFQVFFSAA